jgi:hypothetical protein
MESTFMKRSLIFEMVFQMPNCDASFEVGLKVLKRRLMQKWIISPRTFLFVFHSKSTTLWRVQSFTGTASPKIIKKTTDHDPRHG